MRPTDRRTSYLFKKYYYRTASSVEIEELFELLREISDQELVFLMQEEWENLNTDGSVFNSQKSREMLNQILPDLHIEDSVDKTDHDRFAWISGIGKWSAAAAIIFLIGTGLYMNRPSASRSVPQPPKVAFDDVLPGGNKAVLTLANGTNIILDSIQNGMIVRTSNFEIEKTEDGQVVYNAFDRNYKNAENADVNIISTPRGGEYRITLPDGSKVWLNAASSIKFPAVFRGHIREVELRGEAYFEVAKNAEQPFKVRSRHAEIEVLGTHFNVRAYNDEATVKTTLVEGAVKVRSRNSVNTLKPGEQAVLKSNVMHIVHGLDIEEQIAWKNGLFQFKDASLEVVMNQAALWYDLKVTYAGKIPLKQITGKTSRKVNVSEFLNMLKYMGVKYKRDGKNVLITN